MEKIEVQEDYCFNQDVLKNNEQTWNIVWTEWPLLFAARLKPLLTWYMASHLFSFFGRKPFLQIFKVLQGENSQNRLTWRCGHSSYDTTGFSILFVTPINATFIRSRNSLVHFQSNTPIIALQEYLPINLGLLKYLFVFTQFQTYSPSTFGYGNSITLINTFTWLFSPLSNNSHVFASRRIFASRCLAICLGSISF